MRGAKWGCVWVGCSLVCHTEMARHERRLVLGGWVCGGSTVKVGQTRGDGEYTRQVGEAVHPLVLTCC